MTVASLGFGHRQPNAAQRFVQRVVAMRAGAWLCARILRPIDRLTLRATRGRHTLSSKLAGISVIELRTTGARTGLPRRATVLGVAFGPELAITSGDFGEPSEPAWTRNVVAHPDLVVAYRGLAVPVVARPATEDERAAIVVEAVRACPAMAAYLRRAQSREVHVFVLVGRD